MGEEIELGVLLGALRTAFLLNLGRVASVVGALIGCALAVAASAEVAVVVVVVVGVPRWPEPCAPSVGPTLEGSGAVPPRNIK